LPQIDHVLTTSLLVRIDPDQVNHDFDSNQTICECLSI